MGRFHLVFAVALGILTLASALPHMTQLMSAQIPGSGPYKVLKVTKVGGDGGFDYVNADSDDRRLYVCRSGPMGRILVFDIDTLEQVGEVANVSGHGAVVDPKVNHGFTTSKPIVMFDSKTFATLKTIDVQGNPDGILFDPSSERVYDLSHAAPHVTVIDAKDGSIAGTIDLGGMPEQAVTDGRGHLYIDLEDKDKIAVVDAKTMMLTTTYDLAGKGGTCAALAFDVKNHILFAGCRNPANMVILNSDDGKIITTIPIGVGTDGAVFNPNTMEAFTSQGDGTLTVVKENSPTSFVLEQTVQTMVSAKTLTLDAKTGHILLIAAEYGPPPATPPAGTPPGRPARGPMVPGSFSVLMVGVNK